MNIGFMSLFLDFLGHSLQRFFSFFSLCVCLVVQLRLTLCNPMDCSTPGSSVHGNSPGKTGVDCHALLQEIFLTQELNWGLLHCRQILYQLSYQGSPSLSINWIIPRHLFANLKILSCIWLSLLLNFNINYVFTFILLFFSYRISV